MCLIEVLNEQTERPGLGQLLAGTERGRISRLAEASPFEMPCAIGLRVHLQAPNQAHAAIAGARAFALSGARDNRSTIPAMQAGAL